jgi:hypothetical protein
LTSSRSNNTSISPTSPYFPTPPFPLTGFVIENLKVYVKMVKEGELEKLCEDRRRQRCEINERKDEDDDEEMSVKYERNRIMWERWEKEEEEREKRNARAQGMCFSVFFFTFSFLSFEFILEMDGINM